MSETTSRILFAGDPHGDFAPWRNSVAKFRPAAIVGLGDYDLEQPFEQAIGELGSNCEVAWIHGNHDCDRQNWFDHLFSSSLADGSLHAIVREIAGYRIAGLGGVFRQRIWHPDTGVVHRSPEDYLRANPTRCWREGLPLQHRGSIFWSDYERLWGQRADILVTHEAPSTHIHGFSAIDELAESMGVSLVVHGHHHVTYRATLPSGIAVQGVGLGAVVALDGTVIHAGKLDADRQSRVVSERGHL